ncbi:MAG: hypothetical protein HQL52_16970 [Magnetococcales bacterium]|nr:hypothetical protein [Magnetococcales bacterium]
MVCNHTGNKSKIVTASRRKWDSQDRRQGSTAKANRLLGYQPKVVFKEGLDKNVQWFKDKWDLIQRDHAFPPGISSAVKDRLKK